MKESYLNLVLLVLLLFALRLTSSSSHAPPPPPPPPPPPQPPQPTAVQHAYMQREMGGLITWAVNKDSSGVKACSGCGWTLDAVVPPTEFSPDPNIAAAWARAAKSFGAKSLTLSANHCDGFCMWPTNSTVVDAKTSVAYRYNYSIAYSGIPKRDIVQEFVDACHHEGILPGIYLNIGMNFFCDIGK